MTLDELCQEVLELDKKATKGPWKSDAMPDGSDGHDSTYIEDPNYKYDLEKCPWTNIIALLDRDNLNTRHTDGARWGKQQDDNRESIIHYRTSAPLLAKACLKMKEALEHLEEHHWFEDKPGVACMGCDMGDSGYSTKGDGHHDNRESRYCAVLKCHEALADVDALLKGEK